MRTTQIQRVKNQLKETGKVSRNWCLDSFPRITRLSAIIQILEEQGYTFVPEDKDGDFVYTLSGSPKKPVFRVKHPITGEMITTDQFALL